MKRFVKLELTLLAACLGLGLVACDSFEEIFHDGDEKFRHHIEQVFAYPPATVVAVVGETIQSLKLHVISRNTTNIDGRFWVKSALGVEYKILVHGKRTDKTQIEIHMPSWKNGDQARLILTEIRSRLQFPDLRPLPHNPRRTKQP